MSRLLQRCPDVELLARTEAEPEAFAVFYRRHEVLVLRFLLKRCRDPELAADLTAEIFATVLESASRFDPEQSDGASAVPWLLTIALNTLRTSVRRGVVAEDARRRLECEPVVLEDDEIARIVEVASLDSSIEEILSTLPPDLREAVVARVLDERDYEEIAGELGSSQMVVRKRVSRGLARLRDAFTPETKRKELP
jgi:RNA polymerase sigma factor (sigma-70 family)